ncbi:cytochrome c oxidase subunit 6C-like [Rhynchophorus ferrugineus]
MSSTVSTTLKKPQLRRLLYTNVRNTLISVAVSITVVTAIVKIFHNDARKKAYADFYKNYDINAEFEKMRKKGLFDSCPSD